MVMKSLIVNLNHCSTSARGKIDILFNDRVIKENYESPWANFGKEEFTICKDFDEVKAHVKEGENILLIRLHDPSAGVYWLSDAEVGVKKRVIVDS